MPDNHQHPTFQNKTILARKIHTYIKSLNIMEKGIMQRTGQSARQTCLYRNSMVYVSRTGLISLASGRETETMLAVGSWSKIQSRSTPCPSSGSDCIFTYGCPYSDVNWSMETTDHLNSSSPVRTKNQTTNLDPVTDAGRKRRPLLALSLRFYFSVCFFPLFPIVS